MNFKNMFRNLSSIPAQLILKITQLLASIQGGPKTYSFI